MTSLFTVVWFLEGMEQFSTLALRNLIIKLVNLVMVFVFVRDENDVVIYCLLMSALYLIAEIMLWPSIDAIAISCNTWFLTTFASMLNDKFMYETPSEAITAWNAHMRSMGLGGPLGVDIAGEKGGLLANVNYLNRRYPKGWDGKTIMWAGMGQGDITLTPLQLCNLATVIANRGFYYPPHIHQATESRPLSQRYLTSRQSSIAADAFPIVVEGMRQAVLKGTATSINTADYPICGKTGTVENSGADHSAFIGFAPMNNPQIAIAVFIEHGGWGADMAAPIGGLIIEEYLKGKLSTQSEARAKRIAQSKTK